MKVRGTRLYPSVPVGTAVRCEPDDHGAGQPAKGDWRVAGRHPGSPLKRGGRQKSESEKGESGVQADGSACRVQGRERSKQACTPLFYEHRQVRRFFEGAIREGERRTASPGDDRKEKVLRGAPDRT